MSSVASASLPASWAAASVPRGSPTDCSQSPWTSRVLAASLRAASVPHAAVFLGAEGPGFEPAEDVAACVAETRGALELRRGGRALLQDETEKVCDDLCQLQTNVVS